MSEIQTKVDALRFELAQVKDHPVREFADRAKDIEVEIGEWLSGDAPDEVPPSEQTPPDEAPAAVVEPDVAPVDDVKDAPTV